LGKAFSSSPFLDIIIAKRTPQHRKVLVGISLAPRFGKHPQADGQNSCFVRLRYCGVTHYTYCVGGVPAVPSGFPLAMLSALQ